MKDLLDLKDLTIQREGVPTVDTGAVGPVDRTDCTTLKTSVPLPSHPRNGPPPSPPPATKTPFPWLAGGGGGGGGGEVGRATGGASTFTLGTESFLDHHGPC